MKAQIIAFIVLALLTVSTSAIAQSSASEIPLESWSGRNFTHNGSIVRLDVRQNNATIRYVVPRASLLQHDVEEGTILFVGTALRNRLDGMATIFNASCGNVEYRVTGSINNDGVLELRGNAPVRNADCVLVRMSSTSPSARLRFEATTTSPGQSTARVQSEAESGRSSTQPPPTAPQASPAPSNNQPIAVVSYGSRIGMEVDVFSVTGRNTNTAAAEIRHTERNARSFCEKYDGDFTRECVDRTLRDPGLSRIRNQTTMRANCVTGSFSTPLEDGFHLVGPGQTDQPKMTIQGPSGLVLDGSSASGYPVAVAAITFLCPDLVRTTELAQRRNQDVNIMNFLQGYWAGAVGPNSCSQAFRRSNGRLIHRGPNYGYLHFTRSRVLGVELECRFTGPAVHASNGYRIPMICEGYADDPRRRGTIVISPVGSDRFRVPSFRLTGDPDADHGEYVRCR